MYHISIPQPFLNVNITSIEIKHFNVLKQIQSKCDILQQENQKLKKQINKIQQQVIQKQNTQRKHKKERRTSKQLEKTFKCPFVNCNKYYASELAINLHMKNKHNSGTKSMRQAEAKNIVLAQQKGDNIPKCSINFPPGYLQNFRKKFFNQL